MDKKRTQQQHAPDEENKPIKSSNPTPLQPGIIYHIYNRGINGETLFREERNYSYFLDLYRRHIQSVALTFAYCLMPNHFHLLVEIKDQTVKQPSQAFSNLFNAYSKAINKAYQRTGSLFERPFKRIAVSKSQYFARLIIYIHQNPQRHGIIDDYRLWPCSSYDSYQKTDPTFVERDIVMDWFGNVEQLLDALESELDFQQIKSILYEDE